MDKKPTSSKDLTSFFVVGKKGKLTSSPNDNVDVSQQHGSGLDRHSLGSDVDFIEVEDDENIAGGSKKRSCGTPEKKKRMRGESNIKITHRAQNYRKEWENDALFSKWIAPVKNVKGRALCKLCNITMLAEITILKRHASGQKHTKIAKGVGVCPSLSQGPFSTLDKYVSSPAENVHETNVKTAEIKISAFLAEHNIFFNSADHLIQVLKSVIPDSKIVKSISLGRTKATNVVKNVIGQCCFEEMCEYMQSHKFSLIIDESTDIARTKTLCICVRYFNDQEGNITSKFWKLIDVYDGTDPDVVQKGACAERLFDMIIDALKKDNIPLSNIVGFASDGCNTMMGQFNSVQQKLSDKMPGIVVQKCVCHSLHLCTSSACTALPRKCEDLARNVYAVFKNSSKRIADLREFQHFCEVEPHKILRLSQTRWLSLLAVVQRILEQWDALTLFFSKMWYEERLNAAEMIYVDLQDHFVKMFYFFLDWVLPKFNNLNKLFQGEKVLITYMHTRMQREYKDLLCSYMKREYIMKTHIGKIEPENEVHFLHPNEMYLGVNVLNALQDSDVSKEKEKVGDFMTRCRTFLVIACKEIKKRYDFDDPIFSRLHVLSPKHALSEEAKREPSLLPLMKLLPRLCTSDVYQVIDDQWRKLPDFKTEITSDMDPDSFWAKLLVHQDPAGDFEFRELSQFALDVMVLPHSSATCERVFSKVNSAKTKSRNKLQTPTLNGLLHSDQKVKAGGCYKFEPTEKMLRSMTKSKLYGETEKKKECAAPCDESASGSRPSTSKGFSSYEGLAVEFSKDDMYLGMSSDSDEEL